MHFRWGRRDISEEEMEKIDRELKEEWNQFKKELNRNREPICGILAGITWLVVAVVVGLFLEEKAYFSEADEVLYRRFLYFWIFPCGLGIIGIIFLVYDGIANIMMKLIRKLKGQNQIIRVR